MSDTPLTDVHKAKLPSGINTLDVAVWVANQHLNFARSLERHANAMAEALDICRDFSPEYIKPILAAWRAFEEKYRERG